MSTWTSGDWWVFIGSVIFMILFVGFATGYPQAVWARRKEQPESVGTYDPTEDTWVDYPMAVPEPGEPYTFYLNGDPLCVAGWVEMDDGFWTFLNTGDDMVLVYNPRPGDTLTSEEGGDI